LVIFKSGRILDLIAILACYITYLLITNLAKKGRKLSLRRLPAFDALEELVGRATEMGRAVHFTGGVGSLEGVTAPQVISGLSIMDYISRLTAKNKTELIVTEQRVNVIPMVESILETNYKLEGVEVPPGTLRYIPSGYTYTIGVPALIRRERPAACVLAGPFTHESVMLAQAAAEVGAMQVAGTARTLQIPFFAIIADYCLIGEDLYAAGAYVGGTPETLGALVGEDPFKIISIILLILVGILATFNISWLTDLLGI